MEITILVDDDKSWFIPYAIELQKELQIMGLETELINDAQIAKGGTISFLLSCSKIVDKVFLDKYQHNIVVHASDLPAGKGFVPLRWQILEGKNEIVLTMFEAVDEVDAGPYYQKEKLYFDGSELLEELRETMAKKIIDMCKNYAAAPDYFSATEQSGKESFYRRPTKEDDKLDIDKSIREQFNHLRIADNEKYPLWFTYGGNSYYIKIYKE